MFSFKFRIISWLTGKQVDENEFKKEITGNNSKPKWFEEMVNKNTVNDKEQIKDGKENTANEIIEDFLSDQPAAKESKSNPIYSKRRNTLNILQTENQNFLNTLSKSANQFTEKTIFIDQNLDENLIVQIGGGNETKLELINKLPLNDLNKEESSKQFQNSITNRSECSAVDSARFGKLDNKLMNDVLDDSIEDFIIPDAPVGKTLTMVLKSNHGDENWIGLNGIEIFDLKTYQSISNSNVCVSG